MTEGPNSNSSSRLFDNTRRRLSSIPLPFTNKGELTNEPESITLIHVAPSHRENLALHAIKDSLPKLKLPNVSFHSFIPPLMNKSSISPTRSNSTYTTNGSNESSEENTSADLSKLSGDVLVLGGYRGSILRDATTGKRLWLPLKVGLGIRKVDLSIPLSDEAEGNTVNSVVPGKMLMSAGGVVDLGKRLKNKLKLLEASGAIQFHNFGYDWRRSLELSASELLKELDKIKKNSIEAGGEDGGFKGTTVIAHSMGGLVALYALSQAEDPSLFKGIIFCGTPFQGTVNVLSPFRRGDSVLFNSEVCSPRAVFSMRSSFYFLPPVPNNTVCFEDPTGTPIEVDLLDPISWSTHAISPATANIFEGPSLIKDQQRVISRQEMESSDNHFDFSTFFRKGSTEIEPNLNSDSINLMLSSDDEDDEESKPTTNQSEGNTTPVPRTSTPSDAKIAEYLVKMLDRVQKFHKTLETSFDPNKNYPPLVLLTSSTTPTVRGSLVPSLESIKSDSTYSELLFGAGDGIVLHESSSKLPGNWGEACKGVVHSKAGHGGMLSDLVSMSKAIDLLFD